MKKKNGFTMTEVIIVLSLVGVIALILVPLIKNMMPDDQNIKYKKAFSSIQEVVGNMLTDEGTCQKYNVNTGEKIPYVTHTGKKINALNFCNAVSEADSDSDDMYTYNPRFLDVEVCRRLNTAENVDCTTAGNDGCAEFLTTNGMRWAIPHERLNNSFGASQTIRVNLNGNDASCSGAKATNEYEITVNSDGKITAPETENSLLMASPTD